MTDADAIQKRMDQILGELSADGFSTNVLRPGDPEAVREWRTALESEYQALAASLPPTGIRAYVLEVAGRRLSGDFVTPPQRAAEEVDPEVRADPMLRWMAETDQDWT